MRFQYMFINVYCSYLFGSYPSIHGNLESRKRDSEAGYRWERERTSVRRMSWDRGQAPPSSQ